MNTTLITSALAALLYFSLVGLVSYHVTSLGCHIAAHTRSVDLRRRIAIVIAPSVPTHGRRHDT